MQHQQVAPSKSSFYDRAVSSLERLGGSRLQSDPRVFGHCRNHLRRRSLSANHECLRRLALVRVKGEVADAFCCSPVGVAAADSELIRWVGSSKVSSKKGVIVTPQPPPIQPWRAPLSEVFGILRMFSFQSKASAFRFPTKHEKVYPHLPSSLYIWNQGTIVSSLAVWSRRSVN